MRKPDPEYIGEKFSELDKAEEEVKVLNANAGRLPECAWRAIAIAVDALHLARLYMEDCL